MSKRKNDDMLPNILTYVVLVLLLVLKVGLLISVWSDIPTAQETRTAKVSYVCEATITIRAFEDGLYSVRGSYQDVQHTYTHQLELLQGDTLGIGLSSPVDAVAIWYYDELVTFIRIPNTECESNNDKSSPANSPN